MGSRLLNGSSHFSVRVTLLPLTAVVLASTVTFGTLLGTPTIINCRSKVYNYLYTYVRIYNMHECMHKNWHMAVYIVRK